MKILNKKSAVLITNTIYLITIIAFIMTLVIEYKKGYGYTQSRFNNLVRNTSQNLNDNLIGSDSFRDFFIKSLDPIEDLESIELLYNGKTIAMYPTRNIATAKSSLIKTFKTILSAQDNTAVTLTASFYILKPTTIYNTARICFLVILAFTLLFAIYLFLTKEEASDSLPLSETEVKDTAQPESIKEVIEEETDTDNIEEFDNSDFLDNFSPEETDSSATVVQSADNQEKLNDFNTKTGFGSEEFLIPHLDSELIRANESYHDLSVIILEIKDLDYESSYTPAIISLIKETVKYNDQIFEYKQNQYVMIIADCDIERATILAQNLYKKIDGIINITQKHYPIAMGISSRSIRIITGSRILNEASQALQKGFEDAKNPIVSFKVDPGRYKDYITDEE